MITDLVECDDCFKMGPADEVLICGDWIGGPDNGYPCPDYLCKECRTGETGDWDDDYED